MFRSFLILVFLSVSWTNVSFASANDEERPLLSQAATEIDYDLVRQQVNFIYVAREGFCCTKDKYVQMILNATMHKDFIPRLLKLAAAFGRHNRPFYRAVALELVRQLAAQKGRRNLAQLRETAVKENFDSEFLDRIDQTLERKNKRKRK